MPASAVQVQAKPEAPAPRSASSSGSPRHRALDIGFEQDPALPSELPPGFVRVLDAGEERDALPPFGRIGATDAQACEGRWGLAFELAGGGMTVASEPRLVSAAPSEVFDATIAVLVDGLERSQAGVALMAVDESGSPIEGARWSGMAGNSRGWQRLSLRTGPMPPGTRALEVALEVRPIERDDATGDVSGSVVFDDLELWRVPRVGIEIDRAGAPIGEAPRGAIVTIDDPAPPCTTSLRLFDADNRELGSWTLEQPGSFEIAFPPLGPGSFAVEASVLEGDRALELRTHGIAVGERPARRAPQHEAPIRFGIWIDRPDERTARAMLESIQLVHPDFVVIELGEAATEPTNAMSLASLRRWCDSLRLDGIEPVLRISRIPKALAAELHLEVDDPAAIFELDGDAWRRAYGAWFERFGHVQRRWMIASTQKRTPPWSARLDGLVPGFLECEGIVEAIDAAPSTERRAADSVAGSAIDRWRGGAAMLALRGGIAEEPGAAALAWSALASAARGARSIADLDAGSELGCLLLSCERTARVLLWRRDGGPPSRTALPFDGESMRAVDALGATIELERRQGAVSTEIGSTPIVVDGVDATLGAFLAAIRFEPKRLQGTTAEQDLSMHLANPWDVTMEGMLRFVSPTDWSFVPRFQRFTLAPGAATIVSTRLTLPRSQITGPERVGVELEFTADRGRSLRVDPPIEIAVDDFTCDATLRRVTLADGRPGAVIEVMLSN
ncbi:MAG: hypothetical protein FJ253_01780, partial [Phycisphaerae bacterium]|nr:hypothetical protein [Phycisphaerae bacterium]